MPTLKIRDVNIHYRVLGTGGPWLALITGGRRGFNEFVPLAEKIAAHGVRVLLHDRRNTGASDILIDELFHEIDRWIAEGMNRPKRLKMAKPAALAMAEASLIPLSE